MYVSTICRTGRTLCGRFTLVVALALTVTLSAQGQGIISGRGIVQQISGTGDQLELTVNTSQILKLGTRIPRIQVNNPDLLAVTPLSATEIQVAAKKVGVTQINLWDENDQIYSVDVTILGDARELELALKTQFPESSIKVYKYTNSLVLKGFVDRPDTVSQVMRIAEDYAPKVVNNIMVGGVQQVMLKVKVMEVSRTKLRRLGFDFEVLGSGGSFVSAVSGVDISPDPSINFSVVDGSSSFFGVLDALERNHIAKIISEPVLTTISGRPAKFHVGGEIGYPVAQPGQNNNFVTVEFKDFGTVVDFLPIVLGNGNIRLEVRPTLLEIDPLLGLGDIPGFRKRQIDTGVELKAGQTLALAGLIQQRTDSQMRGLPIVSEIPYVGLPFRRVEDSINEIELLILVTPEFVDGLDPHQVPPCGPGEFTTSPTDHELYLHGYIEVPKCGIDGCSPNGGPWPGAGPFGPGGMPMGPIGPDGTPMFEQVPPGTNGSEEYLPQGAQGTRGYSYPQATPQNDSAWQRLPSSPVLPSSEATPWPPVTPTAEATPFLYDRQPSYSRGNAYRSTDEPPGPIGPIGYDVRE